MTPEVQREYEEMFTTFATQGWKLYIDTMEDHIRVLRESTLDECNSVEDLAFRKGQMFALRYATTMEVTTNQMYKNMMEDMKDADS